LRTLTTLFALVLLLLPPGSGILRAISFEDSCIASCRDIPDVFGKKRKDPNCVLKCMSPRRRSEPRMPAVSPLQTAGPEFCRINLTHKDALKRRLDNLEDVLGEQRRRQIKIGRLYEGEAFISRKVIWDTFEGLVDAFGGLVAHKMETLKKAGNLTGEKEKVFNRVLIGNKTLATLLASERTIERDPKNPDKEDVQEFDKALDASEQMRGILLEAAIERYMGKEYVEIVNVVHSVMIAYLKAESHGRDPNWHQDFGEKIKDALALIGAASKTAGPYIGIAKGSVAIGTGSWYLWATRGNLESLRVAVAHATRAEILLGQRVNDLREKLKVYEKDIALCEKGRTN